MRYWGGSATHKPRLFFGAGTEADPYQTGWCDLGVGGGPIPYTADSTSKPALSSFIETPLDDLGLPGVQKAVERVEIPHVHNADDDNYVEVMAKAGHDGEFTSLVADQTGGANIERIIAEGFARLFADAENPIVGDELALRFLFTQEDDAAVAEWLQLHGTIMLYYTEIPATVQLIDTVLDAKTTDLHVAEEQAAALRAHYGGVYKHLRHGPNGADLYAKVVAAKAGMHEVNSEGKTETRLGIALQLREVMTS